MTKKGEQILDRLESLKANRHNFNSLAQECYDWIDPTDGDVIYRRSDGEDRHSDIYDPTAGEAHEKFVAGMAANITPPDTRTIEISSDKDFLKEDEISTRYFNIVSNVFNRALAASNWSMAAPLAYHDMGITGTPRVMIMPDPRGGFQFENYHYSSTWIAENHLGDVDTLCREFRLTARQAVQKWPNGNFNDQLRRDASDPKLMENEYWFVHEVVPRQDRNPGKLNKLNLPWSSTYVMRDERIIVDEGGFREQPFVAPRFFKNHNEVEGRSPAMRALANVSMINDMMATLIRRANQDADPPLMTPDEDVLAMDTSPGSAFAYNPADGVIPQFLELRGRYDLPEWVVQRYEKAIQNAFYMDFFAMMSTLDRDIERTAFEIGERLKEKVDLLSVVRGRLKREFLDPAMTRCVNILHRQGLLPPMPTEVRDNPGFEFEYRGRLAILAKSLEVRHVTQFLNSAIPYIEIWPDMADNVDADLVMQQLAGAWNATSVTRESGQVSQIRQQRQAAIDQQAMADQFEQATKGVSNLTKGAEANSPLQNLKELA